MLPTAELHVHLEGSAPPALIRRLAERNGVSLPADLLTAQERFRWEGFLDFLRAYDRAASTIRTAADYRDVTYEYLAGCAAQGVLYVELIASRDHARMAGLADADHWAGIAQGIDDARAAWGIEARIISSAVRHLGVDACLDVARHTATLPHPYVVGFTLAGDEANFPAPLFHDAFATVAAAGLGCSVHAGEHDGPGSVRAAIGLPGVTRIGHGVRAAEDPALVAELAERGIVLEVCPTSNVATGVYGSYAEHPLRRLHDAGVRVTLASDDPPYFDTTVAHEHAVAREHFGFTDDELLAITRTALHAAFCDDETRRRLLLRVACAP